MTSWLVWHADKNNNSFHTLTELTHLQTLTSLTLLFSNKSTELVIWTKLSYHRLPYCHPFWMTCTRRSKQLASLLANEPPEHVINTFKRFLLFTRCVNGYPRVQKHDFNPCLLETKQQNTNTKPRESLMFLASFPPLRRFFHCARCMLGLWVFCLSLLLTFFSL